MFLHFGATQAPSNELSPVKAVSIIRPIWPPGRLTLLLWKMNCWYLTDFSPSQNATLGYSNWDSHTADPKNTWHRRHSNFGVPQTPNNQLILAKLVKPETINPGDQLLNQQLTTQHECHLGLPGVKWVVCMESTSHKARMRHKVIL